VKTEEQEIEEKETRIVNTLNSISDIKRQAVEEKSHFYVAKVICDCENLIKELHGENTFYHRENRVVTNQLRNHFAGLAMTSLLTTYADERNVPDEAYSIADDMVKYAKEERQEDKVKGTDDGLDGTTAEDNN
jgi:isopropylmalate/homocitrate/citramalate synthase